ncbi:ATP-grasp domain-containing protein [Sphingomonas jatrophae]|uniref:Glutathione synthase/RimK-type ligase, ATP-grasp superfamily n=1 Tax=Sphingomonas jatrophae TaxID=1166337 RepID=A0A1I6JYW5_9SPHN|nr:alpha-L-glutamate ligase [Sphingomonas jatrophae]SFR83730.1 Glutathione synthase/RimK-type ligase, ATP-grasp superfamily [Sphingomonas jatrophae]
MIDLAILYEHPAWFAPLFAALDRRGVAYRAIHADGFAFDPAESAPPARVVFNRIAMSSFLRSPEHPIFHAAAALAHWQDRGARVLNGAQAMAVDASKARQLSLIAGLGLGIPATRVVHRAADLPEAAAGLRFPIVVKANIGGSGAGIVRYDDVGALAAAVADGSVPDSIDRVLLVQEYAPARGGTITRIETLAGRFLYAIEVDGGGSFDLCPADACAVPGRPTVTMTRVEPDASLVASAEAIVARAGIDVGGVEVLIDDRDATPRFYDINALSNFVANPQGVLGWDPHERLVDWLEGVIAESRA